MANLKSDGVHLGITPTEREPSRLAASWIARLALN